ncbi:putative RNA 2'-phosphotransferase [Catalinimonas alkaloidigena]|uniref:Probable RNA 2'-phosphotransferase n=1 Tax=Catalinimonas alkaloidigena TaxID=1075417 RepID=A0A1G8X040_9BACT|nr:RNA 2'-phosphotransferase [Catalinimonas alkaloidigena]SDJ83794.1 putative RNA 2'-phosphotransferase [Catalinimonas alkaloidigena]
MNSLSAAEEKRLSKFMSLVLRHQPETIGLTLDASGWADVDDLIRRANRKGVALTHDMLRYIVTHNDKQRFRLDETGQRIRASQGHSVPVELGYAPATPPEFLYHGTVAKFMNAIQAEGLQRGSRHHVHLSADRTTAEHVGARRGQPVILTIRAGAMAREGYAFYRSDNGVWLTDEVPAAFIASLQEK